VVMFSCNRPTVSRAIDAVLRYRPSTTRFPLFVSQDCGDAATAEVINSYADHLTHWFFPNGDSVRPHQFHLSFGTYYRIAAHYKWALSKVFDEHEFDQVILLEDDMEIAPDFFQYFEATLPLLQSDPSLYCVSSWNDNGRAGQVSDPHAFYRTDFMPGLGWMMLRRLWTDELHDTWPKVFWDDWMRLRRQRQGRSCIIPEIARNFNFGKDGTSKGEAYDEFIGQTSVNHDSIDYTAVDMSILRKDMYDAIFLSNVYEHGLRITTVQFDSLDQVDQILRDAYTGRRIHDPSLLRLRVEYANKAEFQSLARMFGLMEDVRIDVPRASYLGVVWFKRWVSWDGEEHMVQMYVAPRRGAWHGEVN